MPPTTQTSYKCNLCNHLSSQKCHNDIHINLKTHEKNNLKQT